MADTRISRSIEILCIAVTLAALASIAVSAWPRPPRPNRTLHRAIGAALARQALALLSPGSKIVVITRDTDTFRQPALDLLLHSFNAEVRRGSASVAATQRLQLDALRPVEVPAGDFYEWIRRAPPGEVIVSLLGPPLLSEAQWRQLAPIKAKLVAFCPGNTARSVDLGRLFDAGFLNAAVVGRPVTTQTGGKGRGPDGAFAALYLEVTAATRSRLSALSSLTL
jgi:hypothetical protein